MPGQGKKILVAEDEASLLKAISTKLQMEGFQVFEAKNGEEAFNLSIENHPDLILLDIVMPGMDGLTALQKIREDDWGKDASIMLLTNLNNPEQVATALNYGVFDYLVKSDLKLQEIIDQVKVKLGI